jgi:uncharacterized membrane protein YfcA
MVCSSFQFWRFAFLYACVGCFGRGCGLALRDLVCLFLFVPCAILLPAFILFIFCFPFLFARKKKKRRKKKTKEKKQENALLPLSFASLFDHFLIKKIKEKKIN